MSTFEVINEALKNTILMSQGDSNDFSCSLVVVSNVNQSRSLSVALNLMLTKIVPILLLTDTMFARDEWKGSPKFLSKNVLLSFV